MMTFQTAVHIKRPVEDVFDYVAEPLNFRSGTRPCRAARNVAG